MGNTLRMSNMQCAESLVGDQYINIHMYIVCVTVRMLSYYVVLSQRMAITETCFFIFQFLPNSFCMYSFYFSIFPLLAFAYSTHPPCPLQEYLHVYPPALCNFFLIFIFLEFFRFPYFYTFTLHLASFITVYVCQLLAQIRFVVGDVGGGIDVVVVVAVVVVNVVLSALC